MTTEKTKVALRVLTAVSEKRDPDPRVWRYCACTALKAMAWDPDERVCMAIQQALEVRKAIRNGFSESQTA